LRTHQPGPLAPFMPSGAGTHIVLGDTQLAEAVAQSLLFQMFVQERESTMHGTAAGTGPRRYLCPRPQG
jgi:hypothetical protein